jgi:hypothetical protein
LNCNKAAAAKHHQGNKTLPEQQNPLKAMNCQICQSDESTGATNSSITGRHQPPPKVFLNPTW